LPSPPAPLPSPSPLPACKPNRDTICMELYEGCMRSPVFD
jgi:hypothetical protein